MAYLMDFMSVKPFFLEKRHRPHEPPEERLPEELVRSHLEDGSPYQGTDEKRVEEVGCGSRTR